MQAGTATQTPDLSFREINALIVLWDAPSNEIYATVLDHRFDRLIECGLVEFCDLVSIIERQEYRNAAKMKRDTAIEELRNENYMDAIRVINEAAEHAKAALKTYNVFRLTDAGKRLMEHKMKR
jgi:hypothetical protein